MSVLSPILGGYQLCKKYILSCFMSAKSSFSFKFSLVRPHLSAAVLGRLHSSSSSTWFPNAGPTAVGGTAGLRTAEEGNTDATAEGTYAGSTKSPKSPKSSSVLAGASLDQGSRSTAVGRETVGTVGRVQKSPRSAADRGWRVEAASAGSGEARSPSAEVLSTLPVVGPGGGTRPETGASGRGLRRPPEVLRMRLSEDVSRVS